MYNQEQTLESQKAIKEAFQKLEIAKENSHKGQNGKLLIIGGSELFHAASKWSLDVASKIVDMVFYSSVPSNNTLIKRWQKRESDKKLNQEAKANFWQGIVVSRKEIETYLKEADCVLLGPGMERSSYTAQLSDHLLSKYPEKKWVIDAGALQMINPDLFNSNCIITPHHQEMEVLIKKNNDFNPEKYQALPTCLLKGQTDQIFPGKNYPQVKVITISGGNAGMTKGGTGDVLAGLLAALYCKNEALVSAIIASYINKKTGDSLYKNVGPYFNTSDLVGKIPQVLWQAIQDKT
jgi:NAD(P)H-hydrate epimerase